MWELSLCVRCRCAHVVSKSQLLSKVNRWEIANYHQCRYRVSNGTEIDLCLFIRAQFW